MFLGKDAAETRIINEVHQRGFSVVHSKDQVNDFSEFDLVVSFGFRHIISAQQLNTAHLAINLHISYLPWNKGAHPNFWAHWDNTPSGVTIHKIDSGIDTGPILFQKYITFNKSENTFELTYKRLNSEIEEMFLENFDSIYSHNFELIPQRGEGTFHKPSDLPTEFSGWKAEILSEIKKLEKNNFQPNAKYLEVIDKIEQARTTNNVNWMDLLRVVAIKSPSDLKLITNKIHSQDVEILELFKRLAE